MRAFERRDLRFAFLHRGAGAGLVEADQQLTALHPVAFRNEDFGDGAAILALHDLRTAAGDDLRRGRG